MLRLQAFKYELRVNGKQKRDMARFAGSCRFVYNKALALQKECYEAGGKFISYVEMARNLTSWRHSQETPWLKEAPCHPLQHALKDLDRAYKNFFAGRALFPRFKQKGKGGSFRFPDALQIELDEKNNRICLPKLGWIRYRNSREIIGKLCNVTLSSQGDKWFISIQTECEVETPVKTMPKAVGIDVGITHFATLSTKEHVAPINSFKKHRVLLTKYQRKLAKKIKYSQNWKKAKKKLQKVHTHIANARKDFLHKTTTAISKNHAIVCIEDLQVKKMSRSAKGTLENPGKRVVQKRGFNRSILDQGWGMFAQQLEYKMKWSGGLLIVVPPHHTSQTCPCCKHITEANRKTQSLFKCVVCNYENNADIVGAINIEERGLALVSLWRDDADIRSLSEVGTHRSALASLIG